MRFTNKGILVDRESGRVILPKGTVGRIPSSSNPYLKPREIYKANRFLKQQQIRLIKAIDAKNYQLAFRVMLYLTERSVAFRVMWFNKVMRGGYRTSTYGEVKSQLSKLDRIIRNADGNLEVKRVMIPKPDGRERPLGVPSVPYRVGTAMGTYLLTLLLSNEMSPNQHAYRPTFSTATAVKQFMEEAPKYKGVYEFDLSGFFNTVNREMIDSELLRLGVPYELVQFLSRINTMTPALVGNEGLSVYEKEMKNVNWHSEDLKGYAKGGLPQGLAGSPILSCGILDLVLKNKLTLDGKVIMYSDDGILLTNKRSDIDRLTSNKTLQKLGIEFSYKDKGNGLLATRIVTEDNVKFLGATLYGKENMLIGKDGKTLTRVTERTLSEISKFVGLGYKERNKNDNWKWEIEEDSFLVRELERLGILYRIRNSGRFLYYEMRRIATKKTHPYRKYKNFYYNTEEISTICCDRLLWILRYGTDRRARGNFPGGSAFRFKYGPLGAKEITKLEYVLRNQMVSFAHFGQKTRSAKLMLEDFKFNRRTCQNYDFGKPIGRECEGRVFKQWKSYGSKGIFSGDNLTLIGRFRMRYGTDFRKFNRLYRETGGRINTSLLQAQPTGMHYAGVLALR